MKGIILKDTIRMFGFKNGFSFWFKWNFENPINKFVWTYITRKPLCTEHGYYMCDKNCSSIKLIKRKEKVMYLKEHREKVEKESKTIRGASDGICVYCGEEKGTELIDDPNWNTLERWLVCKTCKEVIEIQRELVFSSSPKIGNPERVIKLNNKLLKISEETGKPIIIMQLGRVGTKYEISKDNKLKEIGHKYKTSSVTYTGEKDEKKKN